MPYPPRYLPQTDFALAEQSGEPVSGVDLASELSRLAETTQQVIAFVRAGFTSDKRWQPSSALSQEMVQSGEYVATPGQTVFPLPNASQADPASDFVRVYVDGVRLASASLSLPPDDPLVPGVASNVELVNPLAGGEEVIVELINDYATLREQLASNLNSVGASLVGIEDALGKFSATTVEDALAELVVRHDALLAALGDLSLYAKIDGSRAWQQNQSMGGNRLTDLADGQAQQDAVTVAQLDALAAIYGDLSAIYLEQDGGTMRGAINMANNRIHNLPAAEQAQQPVILAQLAALEARVASLYLPLAGGDMVGELNVLDPVNAQNPVPLKDLQELDTRLTQTVQGHPDAIAAGLGVFVAKGGQNALLTDETDTELVLRPNGTGGVVFGPVPVAVVGQVNYGSGGVSVSTEGTWVVQGMFASDTEFGPAYFGQCVVVNGTIVYQYSMRMNATGTGGDATDVRGTFDMFNPTTVRWSVANPGSGNVGGSLIATRTA